MQFLLPRSHGRLKPIKFFRRRPVPPHPDPESQRVDISKPPTFHEWRPLCLVCVAAWDLTDPPSSQCTSPAHGHPRVVHEMASNLPSTIDLTQSLHMAGTDEGPGHTRSARRSSDDRNIKKHHHDPRAGQVSGWRSSTDFARCPRRDGSRLSTTSDRNR